MNQVGGKVSEVVNSAKSQPLAEPTLEPIKKTTIHKLVEPWQALLVYVLSFFAQNLLIVPVLFAVLLAYGFDLGSLSDGGLAELDLPIGANMIVYAASVLIGLSVILIYMRIKKVSLKSIGLTAPKPSGILALIPTFFVYFMATAVAFVILEQLLPVDILEQEQVTGFEDPSGAVEMVLAFTALVIIAPISEEIVYRGFLFNSFKKRLSKPVMIAGLLVSTIFLSFQLFDVGQDISAESAAPLILPLLLAVSILFIPQRALDAVPKWFRLTVAALVVSALFGVAHGQLNVAVDTFILSLFMIGLTVQSGSIVPAIMLHMMKNGLAFYVLFINPDFLDTLE